MRIKKDIKQFLFRIITYYLIIVDMILSIHIV
jgi:hypothetical protein